ncbi:hypothetical protein P7228_05540 [Altererythrobacter arenosus]|uniref:AcrB/AcrD/AcrF family protein n=1 Tax=Altererythrobacter arenosus TaxID=3032592 RepID=A0ABY8G1N2_9SPHN|nr:hypothetical protein [Altererythrobacter sp. CAU 1644]WFL78529.1 hypothetical protein P7228_05540 [Altererythrobacter sp. CAU 1644]
MAAAQPDRVQTGGEWLTMLVERRRSAFTGDLLIRIGLAWIAVSALLLVTKLGAIRGLALPDPDDVMRLVQVRDLYAGQGWFDVTQHRVDAVSGGVGMHWSRLVDLPILAVIAALTPVLGQTWAEGVALVTVPLVTLGCAMLLAGRIAWRLLGEEETTMTVVVMALSVPLLFQMSPLRIDHHGWQVVLALAAVNGMMARNARAGAWVAGLSVAAWLTISIEGLPLAAALFAIAALRWWRNRCDKLWLAHMMKALATGSIALFAATRGLGDLVTYCDAIGPVHIGMFCWGALVLSATAASEPLPRAGLLLGFLIAGAGAVAFYVVSVPQCAAGGGFAGMDPLLEQYWHGQVAEGLPIWRQSIDVALQIAALPLLGLFASLRLALRSHDWLRRWWIEYTMILLAAFAVSLLVARAGAVAGALAAVPVGWQLREWLRSIRNMKRTEVRVLALAGVACALLPALPLMLLTTAMPVQASSAPIAAAPKLQRSAACDVRASADALRTLPVGEFYAPLDLGPQLLLHTKHEVIATGHHRGQGGMVLVVETALGSSEAARQALRARGTEYVAICPGLNEAEIYANAAPHGFVAQLSQSDAPDWLEPVPLDSKSGLSVWRVRRN